ncbi:MAG: hypothetical protein ACOYNO_02925 [Saprospiraceae bacterium]|jgi:hypothetical protein
MHILRNLLLLTAFVAMLSSCGPSIQATGSWVDQQKIRPESYKTICVMALTAKMNIRQTLENDLAAELERRGIKAVKSYNLFPPSFDKTAPGSKDVMAKKIAEANCDAIFTTALIDQKSETRYVPGSTMYAPYPNYGYYGNFYGYYNYSYPTFYDPGYITTDKTFFLESNLYDAKAGDLVFSVQSETYNPSNLEGFSRDYTILMLEEMKKKGIIKK